MLLFYEPAISAFDRAGLPSAIRLMLGSGEIVASMLFLIPATRRLGAWGLLAMIGGAILLHLAIGSYSVGNLLIDGAAITVVLVYDTVQTASRHCWKTAAMTDAEFMRSFEAGTIAGDSFHHRDHVRAAWLFLRHYSVLEALRRFTEGLKRIAAVQGKAGLYHETITWSYIFLIRERMQRMPDGQCWEEFGSENADLFDWKNNILKSYYHEETLNSELARGIFVLPDRERPVGT